MDPSTAPYTRNEFIRIEPFTRLELKQLSEYVFSCGGIDCLECVSIEQAELIGDFYKCRLRGASNLFEVRVQSRYVHLVRLVQERWYHNWDD